MDVHPVEMLISRCIISDRMHHSDVTTTVSLQYSMPRIMSSSFIITQLLLLLLHVHPRHRFRHHQLMTEEKLPSLCGAGHPKCYANSLEATTMIVVARLLGLYNWNVCSCWKQGFWQNEQQEQTRMATMMKHSIRLTTVKPSHIQTSLRSTVTL